MATLVRFQILTHLHLKRNMTHKKIHKEYENRNGKSGLSAL
jgi:hypothetical protein